MAEIKMIGKRLNLQQLSLFYIVELVVNNIFMFLDTLKEFQIV